MSQRFPITCTMCGSEDTVPFEPRDHSTVLCRQCFKDEKRQNSGGGQRQAAPRQPSDSNGASTSALAVRTATPQVEVVGQAEHLALAPGRKAEVVWKELTIQKEMTVQIGDKRIIYSNVWDFIAQERGISFGTPVILENTDERVVVEVAADYLNRMGRKVHDAETYEVDCRWVYEMKRLNWSPPEWENVLDENGNLIWQECQDGKNRPKRRRVDQAAKVAELQDQGYLLDEPVYNEEDVPVGFKRRLPPAVEKELWDNHLSLKKTKLARAITACHRRITQRAIGTKSLDAGSLKLRFPSIIQHFSDVEIQDAVDDIYGEEDLAPQEEVHDAEFVESPRDATEPEPAPPPAAPSTEPADEKAERQRLYAKIFGLAKDCGEPGADNVKARLAEWGCCNLGDDGRPSMRASSLDQVREAVRRYTQLQKELQMAQEAAF